MSDDDTPMEELVYDEFETYYTTGEVARMAGVHTGTVYRWMRDKVLKGYKSPAGRYRFAASEVKPILMRRADAERSSFASIHDYNTYRKAVAEAMREDNEGDAA